MDIMLQRILELVGTKHGAKKELMDALGLPSNLVTEWKQGRVKSYPKYAPRIADYYGVSMDWLSGLTDEKEQKERPTTVSDDGLEANLKLFMSLSEEKRKVVLELMRQLKSAEESQ